MTNNLIILPIYLQKYIIKFICLEINKISKNCFFNKNEIDQLKKSLSLTCWNFFKTLSLNLSVLIINNENNDNQQIKKITNSNNSKFQLLKLENINFINFIYHFKNNHFLNLNSFNNEIIKFENLNKIIIDRCDLNIINKINFSNIKINDYYLSCSGSTNSSSSSIPNNIKEITNLSIAPNNNNNNLIFEFFKQGIKIKRILEFDYYSSTQIPFKKILSLPVKVLNSIKNYNLGILTIKDFYYLLKCSKFLKRLSFYICFNNLIYQLTRRTDTKSVQPPQIPCNCSINNQHEEITDENEFNFYWEFISNEISNHKKLKLLKISNKCLVNLDSIIENGNLKDESYPIEFISKLADPLSKNNSIKVLKINGINTSQLISKIIENGNKSIIDYN